MIIAAEARTDSHMLNLYIHLDWGRSRQRWTQLYLGGQVADKDPYCYAVLERYFRVAYSIDRSESRLRAFTRRGLAWVLGFDLIHAWRNREQIRSADIVVTHTEHEHLAVLLLLRIWRDRRVKVICQSIWLWDKWDSLTWLRRKFLRFLLDRASVSTVHSPVNLNKAVSVLPSCPAFLVPFGITPHKPVAAASQSGPTLKVLAVGNDRDRDWGCLANAARMVSSIEVRVRSRRRAAKKIAGEKISVGSSRSIREYRADLEWCDVVVVPVRENSHASGITVALEALSSGRVVVIADTGGVRSYLSQVPIYYEAGNPKALAHALLAVKTGDYRSPGVVHLPSLGLSGVDYAMRHLHIVNWLQGTLLDTQIISRLESVGETL